MAIGHVRSNEVTDQGGNLLSRILVTGAAGFIGSNLVDRLLVLGHEVVGLDSFTGYYPRQIKERNLLHASSRKHFRLVEANLLETDLEEVLRRVEGVVHLAAEPGVRASWGDNFAVYIRRNVEATQRLLEAILQRGPRPFIFASSSPVYGSSREGPVKEDAPRRPASPYGLSKLAAEELVGLYGREWGLPTTALRYFTVYGPRQRPEMALSRFISLAAREKPIQVFGDGEQVREMTYVSDVVDATVAALEASPGGVYNVGGGTRATVNELIEAVQRSLGKKIEINYEPAARGDVRSTWANLDRTTQELGYRPQVGLSEGIAAQIEWIMDGEFVGETPPGHPANAGSSCNAP